jgi:hypothetical protein
MPEERKILLLRINKSLLDQFKAYAHTLGITRSKILRDWIREFQRPDIHQPISSLEINNAVYSLYIDEDLQKKICFFCNSLNVRKSQLIRYIIKKNISHQINNKKDKNGQKDLFSRGNFQEIINQLSTKNIEEIQIRELYLISRAYERLGKLDQAERCLLVLLSKIKHETIYKRFFVKANLIKIQIEIFKGESTIAFLLLNKVKEFIFSLNDRELFAQYYYCQAELYRVLDNIDKTEFYYEKALEYLDIINYPTQTAEIYIRHASLLIYLNKFSSVTKYLTKSYSILENTNNIHYWGQYYNTKGIYEYLKGDAVKGKEFLRQSLYYNSKNNSTKELTYNNENFIRIALIQGHNNKAYELIMKNKILEEKFRPHCKFNRTTLFELFLKSKKDYKSSVKVMSNFLLHKEFAIKPNLVRYFLYSAQLLNSDSKIEQNKGRINLKSLSYNGSYELVKVAAQKTLITKTLQPII